MNQPSARAEHSSISSHTHSLLSTVCLTGFMGAGKTTIGRLLAASAGCDFVDLDDIVEDREGMKIRELFARRGEAGFREAECTALESLLEVEGEAKVIALGGGAFTTREVRELLQRRGVSTIFLEAPADELYRRCVDSLDAPARPLLKDPSSFKKLYAERLPFYEQAERRISTSGKTAEQVAAELKQWLRDAGPGPQRKVR